VLDQLLADRPVLSAIKRANNPYHDIESPGLLPVVPKHFPYHAPHVVSGYRSTGDLAGNHDSKAGEAE
jgi:hypothetical protein